MTGVDDRGRLREVGRDVGDLRGEDDVLLVDRGASTADIRLFRGTAIADWTIRAAINSLISHIGMVLAFEDLPALLGHAELGRSLRDVWTGERHGGVQLHLLSDAVVTWSERYTGAARRYKANCKRAAPHEPLERDAGTLANAAVRTGAAQTQKRSPRAVVAVHGSCEAQRRMVCRRLAVDKATDGRRP
jgi:hypothetical protein